ncbi:MAG: TIGR02757 family protein [Bacteroidaceae bacterium]|nr:TIGR02757 family protein [Bacteroidaceae bacterium]
MEKLKKFLDEKVAAYNTPAFIANDPVQFPHAFSDQRDIEIAALLASVIAWGNRTMIIRSGKKMLFDIMGGKPYDFIMRGSWLSLDDANNIHRTFFVRDFKYLCRGLQYIYNNHNTMEALFADESDTWSGIHRLRSSLAHSNDGVSTRHISNPVALSGKPASACKRLHMMLRWLCRRDGIVDLGIWQQIDPARLMIPVDVHVSRTGRMLGLIERKANDRRTVEMLTEKLSILCPEDPVKYDFALFGIGVEGGTI